MGTPGTSTKGSQSFAEWLPLLGSIVLALRNIAEDDPTAARTVAAAPSHSDETGLGEISPGETAR